MVSVRCRLVFSCCALALWAGPARPATFEVTSTVDGSDDVPGDGTCSVASLGGACSLRAACEEANALFGPDEVVIPAGIHRLDDEVEIVGPLTLRGEGGTPEIRAAWSTQRRFLLFSGGPERTAVALVDLALGSSPLSIHDGDLRLERVQLNQLRATGDASLVLRSGSTAFGVNVEDGARLTAEDWAFQENGIGPALFLRNADALLDHCSVRFGAPGIEAVDSMLLVRDSTITRNSRLFSCARLISGAGVRIEGGSARFERCLIAENEIWQTDCDLPNQAGQGAGVSGHGDVELVNCTIRDNRVSLSSTSQFPPSLSATAGGVLGCVLDSCTVVGNWATVYTGFELETARSGGVHGSIVTNSIIAGNIARASTEYGGSVDGCGDCGVVQFGGYALIGDASCCGSSGDMTGVQMNADPQLVERWLGVFGATTLVPSSGSPAIDAGPAAGHPAVDQAGTPRPQGAGVDIGAVEACAPDALDTDGDGECDLWDEDDDGDDFPDHLDCAPLDGSNWAPPGLADLRVTGGSSPTLSWLWPAGTGSALPLLADVLRSENPVDFTAASCLASATPDDRYRDDDAAGADLLAYLVRVETACGSSPLLSTALPDCP